MRVSLRQPLPPAGSDPSASPLLDPAGPRRVMGRAPGGSGEAEPLTVSDRHLFGPRGAVLGAGGGPLVVSDTGHHRLLVWRRQPETDEAPADLVIGQPTFAVEGRNGKREPDAASLNVPTGVALVGDVLAVADAWNHRVLLWHGLPEHSNQPADVVLGQADFGSVLVNRGSASAAADTLNWCYGVSILDGRLVVADTGNRRVLVWEGIPEKNGQPADLVLGQPGPDTRDENAGRDPGPLGMRWPHSVAMSGGRWLVADAGNNRVLVWNRLPGAAGVPADSALGQQDFLSLEHNRGHYLPDAVGCNMPYGVAADDRRVLVADTANSRMIGWRGQSLGTGRPAVAVAGQPGFGAKGDNRWGPPVRDSLCWPYGVTLCGETAVISDSGNNRVLLWDLDRSFAS
ncbi:MAG: hypothetical protein KDD11_23815 [Acidobacteria bacterium]|nr:hypothetical protein [Acidobacteriota bacterium]